MKKGFFVLGFFIAIAFAVSSCGEDGDDACDGISCQNGGTCSDGICTCPSGYSGDFCETAANAKYAGTYTGPNTCNPGPSSTITVTITALSNPLNVSINYDGVTLSGTIANSQLVIASQTVAGTTYSGSALVTTILGSKTLNMTLVINDGTSRTCSFLG